MHPFLHVALSPPPSGGASPAAPLWCIPAVSTPLPQPSIPADRKGERAAISQSLLLEPRPSLLSLLLVSPPGPRGDFCACANLDEAAPVNRMPPYEVAGTAKWMSFQPIQHTLYPIRPRPGGGESSRNRGSGIPSQTSTPRPTPSPSIVPRCVRPLLSRRRPLFFFPTYHSGTQLRFVTVC